MSGSSRHGLLCRVGLAGSAARHYCLKSVFFTVVMNESISIGAYEDYMRDVFKMLSSEILLSVLAFYPH